MTEVYCWARDVAQMLCLASTKSWAQFTALHTLGGVLHACNPSIHEAEAGRSEIQDHLWLHIGSLMPAWDTVRPCLKIRKQNGVVLGAVTLSRTDLPICVL